MAAIPPDFGGDRQFIAEPEDAGLPTTIATQLWNHFESYGFELSIGTSTFKCKEPSKPYKFA